MGSGTNVAGKIGSVVKDGGCKNVEDGALGMLRVLETNITEGRTRLRKVWRPAALSLGRDVWCSVTGRDTDSRGH